MNNDLLKYRLNDDSELDVYRKDMVRFVQFQEEVYNMLDGLAPGDTINVCEVVVPESIDVFIKVVCQYIYYHQHDDISMDKIEFSADYRKIYRRPGYVKPVHLSRHFYSK